MNESACCTIPSHLFLNLHHFSSHFQYTLFITNLVTITSIVQHTSDKQIVRANYSMDVIPVMMTRVLSNFSSVQSLNNKQSFFLYLSLTHTLSPLFLTIGLLFSTASILRESLPVILPTAPSLSVLFYSVSSWIYYSIFWFPCRLDYFCSVIWSFLCLQISAMSHTMNPGESHSRKRQSSRYLFHVHLAFDWP